MKEILFNYDQSIKSRLDFSGWFFPILLYLVFVSPGYATDASQSINSKSQLVILSSFPEKMTTLYKKAFEKKNPDVEVKFLHKKTSKGLKYLDSHEEVDLFWVSAPDAFEVLKKKNLLQQYISKAKGIPRRISGYPINDPDGFYSGFSAAGYGIMWNTEYLKEHGLNIELSAPSRSGTTHLTVETILQIKGWESGWSLVKGIAANAKVITQKRSHAVRDIVY